MYFRQIIPHEELVSTKHPDYCEEEQKLKLALKFMSKSKYDAEEYVDFWTTIYSK